MQLKKFAASRITLNAAAEYNLKSKTLSYRSKGRVALSDAAVKGGLTVAYDLTGGKSDIKLTEITLSGAKIDARIGADYVFAGHKLSGSAVIERALLRNGGIVSTELYFDPIDDGFMCFAPQIQLGDKTFTALQLNLCRCRKSRQTHCKRQLSSGDKIRAGKSLAFRNVFRQSRPNGGVFFFRREKRFCCARAVYF